MSRAPAVKVEGLRELRRSLKAAGVSLQDLRDEHARIASIVVDAAAPSAPVLTGALLASTRPAGTQAAAIVRAGRASVPYAGPVHWGWPARHIPAQPWIYDAAIASREQWTGVYLATLEKIIDSIEGTTGP